MPRPANPTLADDILTAALRLVEQKGPSGFTMREVAGELGYSATAIYQHFTSKEALLLALKLRAGDLLAGEMEVARRGATLEIQLHGMAHRYLEFGLQNPAYYRLIFQDTLPSLQLPPEHHERMQRAWDHRGPRGECGLGHRSWDYVPCAVEPPAVQRAGYASYPA
jgi:AcrR family transcriptional regulator